jgi:phage anti-repressor protein
MEMIKISNEEGRSTVDARELHKFLESKKDFSDWIKQRVKRGRFVENTDFTTIQGKSIGGRPSKEYYLTLDMAKDICMLENNKKGDEVRAYFRECEAFAKKDKEVVVSSTEALLQSVQLLVEQERKMVEITNRLDKVEARQITHPEDFFTVSGYCSLKGIHVGLSQAADFGRKCSKYSRLNDIPVEKVRDSRYGQVNSYHTDVLEEIIC